MVTNEYFDGNAELAAQLGCTNDSGELSKCPKGITYVLPSENGDSWFVDIHPKPGLFVSDVNFTLQRPLTRTYEIKQPGLFLCSFESGEVTLFERGKKARRMRQGIHLLVNQGKPFKVVFGSEQHTRYTMVWVFADFISTYLQDREWKESLEIKDALTWPSHYYNTPELLLYFQQLQIAIRRGMAPLMYFESKVIAILSLILCAVQTPQHVEWFQKKERPKHATYEDQQFVWKVKAELDKDILNPPPVKELSSIAGMGATKLRILFKSCYGMNIADYLRQEKMNYALHLLAKEDMSIQKISTLLGYASPSMFTAAFKTVHGFTPRDARKKFTISRTGIF